MEARQRSFSQLEVVQKLHLTQWESENNLKAQHCRASAISTFVVTGVASRKTMDVSFAKQSRSFLALFWLLLRLKVLHQTIISTLVGTKGQTFSTVSLHY